MDAYFIEITEVRKKTIKIEANNIEEAKEKVKNLYCYEERIKINDDFICETKFEEK